MKQSFVKGNKHLNLVSANFLDVQFFWGHKKLFFNKLSSTYFLGLRNNNLIFNTEYAKEFIKRMLLFCMESIFKNINILFICHPYVKLILFFASRCLEYISYNKWISGLLTNYTFRNSNILILTNMLKNPIILKESFKVLLPIICFEDSDYSFNKSLYPIPMNDDSKESISNFCLILTNNIIKFKLFRYCKNIFK
jgi:ribosomal protein S2